MAPKSSLHATAAIPRETALNGRQNQVRVADGPQALGDIGICEDWDPAEEADEINGRSNGSEGGNSKCCGVH